MNEGPVVCDAGPLIALAGVAQLPLLRALYPRILVPEPVIEEIVRSGAGRAGAIEIGSAHWLEVVPPPDEPDALLSAELALARAPC